MAFQLRIDRNVGEYPSLIDTLPYIAKSNQNLKHLPYKAEESMESAIPSTLGNRIPNI